MNTKQRESSGRRRFTHRQRVTYKGKAFQFCRYDGDDVAVYDGRGHVLWISGPDSSQVEPAPEEASRAKEDEEQGLLEDQWDRICYDHTGEGWDEPERPRKRRAGAKPRGNRKGKGGGAAERWRVINNFVDFTLRDLTPAQIKVWLVLFRDSKGGTVATAQRQISERAGCGLKFVNQAVKSLVKAGLLRVVHQGGYRKGTSRYRVYGLIPAD